MAIDLKHPDIFTPQSNVNIARYSNIIKFISLIKDKALFFCRADKFEDALEGSLPHFNYKAKELFYRDQCQLLNINATNERIEKEAKEFIDFQHSIRNLFCINCWNKFDSELAALWKIYSAINDGLLIKSNTGRLVKSLNNSQHTIYMSEVKYIDYAKDTIPNDNLFYPYQHKSNVYSYENEIRLIYQVITVNGWDYNWDCSKYKNGIYIEIDLNELIEEIIISPYSPDWYYDIVYDLLLKYRLENIPIRKSNILLNTN